jgi:hydroxymethylglutaryl-CoA lyase
MSQIIIHEVGPRDGLQAEAQHMPLPVKEALIRGIMATGVDIVQVGSFVNPERVPQMADTDALCKRLAGAKGSLLSGLVLNERGLERALACGVPMICMGVSASDTHSRKNTGMGTEEALRRIIPLARIAMAAGRQIQVCVQSAFGCGYEGRVPDERVLGMVQAYLDAGLTHISLADTAGHGHPEQIKRLYGAVFALKPEPAQCTFHAHDTYALGMANLLAALGEGVNTFETSLGGLGGCPFTKVAAGNVATEDLVHTLRRTGLRPDIDLGRLVGLAKELSTFFNRELPGRVHRAGLLEY